MSFTALPGAWTRPAYPATGGLAPIRLTRPSSLTGRLLARRGLLRRLGALGRRLLGRGSLRAAPLGAARGRRLLLGRRDRGLQGLHQVDDPRGRLLGRCLDRL